ncbi:MAG: hypothetical protein N2045_12750 [Fimbriimonadales bacterium]|nr:hypothetical protein [Fimbriimonadales bacterium]
MLKRWILLFGLLTPLALACAQPFTYQGLLKDGGNPANGNYQMTFRLFNAATGGTALGTVGPLTVPVNNGLFSVELNFPASIWNGETRYLEIQVGSTVLTPRVKINPTPYASTLRMFESGTNNPDRMVIAHSPPFTNWGLQYQDVGDKFNFLAGGTPVMTVDLGTQCVGINNSSPIAPLSFANALGNKIAFWGNPDATQYGIGLQSGLLQIYCDTSAASIAFGRGNSAAFTEVMRITGGGNVGIGTNNPAARLDIAGGAWDTSTTEGDLRIGNAAYRLKMGISTGGGGAGHATIAAQGGANLLSLGAGTTLATQRTLTITGAGNVGIGTISPATTLHVEGTARVRVLEITGADFAEKFPTTDEVQPGMVVEIDPDNPGNLRLARGAYNKRVAGIVAGANGLSKGIVLGNTEGSENHTPIAISGRVWVYADATEQAIEPGDFLTTAERPGYAMKAIDLQKAQGAILGKAMTRLERGKTGFVLVLVNLQ